MVGSERGDNMPSVSAADTRCNAEPPRRSHTPDRRRPRIPMPSRIHAGVFRACQTQRASEPADLSSSASSKEAVDLGTVRAPQSREAGKPGHGLPICRVDCIYGRPERRPKDLSSALVKRLTLEGLSLFIPNMEQLYLFLSCSDAEKSSPCEESLSTATQPRELSSPSSPLSSPSAPRLFC
ncbi:hypothetical protein ACRRTK_024059 [Alexandromys fortis]